jgi:RNA polymerase sigma factor (sigma-70 family)
MCQIIANSDISAKRAILDTEFVANNDKLLSFARSMARKWMFDELAEDDEHAALMLLHDSYIRAVFALPHFQPERQPICFWLLKIMHYLLLEMRRSRHTQRRQHDLHLSLSDMEGQIVTNKPLHQTTSSKTQFDEDVLTHDQLQETLSHLNHQDRMIVNLYHFHDIAGPDIARMLDWSTQQFHSHLYYIHRYLRTFLPNS